VNNRNAGLVADPLFVGATRPAMLWGVTYSAVMLNGMCVMELFLLTKNLLILLIAAPVHGVCMLLCARDARFFDLTLLWGRTRLPAFLGNLRFWKASSYSALVLDLPNTSGRRSHGATCVRVAHVERNIPASGSQRHP
jgi:type IV secretion system protein VirB3